MQIQELSYTLNNELLEEIKDDQFLGINLDGLISKILSQVNGYGVLDNIVNDKEVLFGTFIYGLYDEKKQAKKK